MQKLGIIILVSVLICGCASQIMQSYIGKDLREVMLDYGEPENAFDMGDGRRAFQWVIRSSYTTPVTVTTNGTVSTNVSAYRSKSWVNSNTTISGGQTIESECAYTLFAVWNTSTNSWVVTDYRKPKTMCE